MDMGVSTESATIRRTPGKVAAHFADVLQAIMTAEEEAAELLAFFGEAAPPQRRGALASLQVFLGNVQAFAKQFASAVQEVKAHHGHGHGHAGQGRLQRSASLARRIGDEEPRESGRPSAARRSLSSGAVRQEGPVQPRRLGRTKTRHMEPTRAFPASREHPVLLSHQEIKAQLKAPLTPGLIKGLCLCAGLTRMRSQWCTEFSSFQSDEACNSVDARAPDVLDRLTSIHTGDLAVLERPANGIGSFVKEPAETEAPAAEEPSVDPPEEGKAEEAAEEAPEEDAKEEAADEKEAEVATKEDKKEEEKDEEEDEMAAFLEGIEHIDEAKGKEPPGDGSKAKEDGGMEVCNTAEDGMEDVPEQSEPAKPSGVDEEAKEQSTATPPEPAEDEDMMAFLQGIEQVEEPKTDEADRSSDGKADDSTILESGEGTPCGTDAGATESAEDDFAAFLGALDDMEDKKDGKPEEAAEEGDGLDDLPAVEIKRRLRAEGVAIPTGPEDKEELVTLLRETLNKPKGDAFMDFLSEIDKMQPGADVEMKDAAPEESAFADFLKEIDGMPTGAEAGAAPPKKTERPLTMRYSAESRQWTVFVGPDKEAEEFPAQASPILARRQALEFCRTTLLEMEKRGEVDKMEDESHKAELLKILEDLKAQPSRRTIHRGLDFNCMHLLVQYANGKNSFHWPVKVRQALGNRHAQSYTAEVEQKFELHHPIHPFQLAWRVCLDRSSGASSFGLGNFRNPAGLVISCPSKRAYVRLQKHQAKQAIESASVQRKLQQEQQQRLETLLAAASGDEEVVAINKKVAAETKAALAAHEAEQCNYTRWARRLERLAVFAGAQGREDSGNVQLEGLTVLPNLDGSNALPVLLLLAFFRPRTCGGVLTGGCSALCDLDSLKVRAVSLFGRSQESRWVLPITGRQKLTLDDLQHVNTLRQAVSSAFEVDDDVAGKDEAKDKKDAAKPTARPRGRRIYIKEDAETTRSRDKTAPASTAPKVADGEKEEDASAAPATDKKARLLGDVWIDIAEEGAAEAADAATPSPEAGDDFSGSGASLVAFPGNARADFASLAPGQNLSHHSAITIVKRKILVLINQFAFLPELSLSQALKDRADSFLAMQTEATSADASAAPALMQHTRSVQKSGDAQEERKSLGLQQGRGQRSSRKKMMWLSAISLAPQCDQMDSYMSQYEIALTSWKESGSHLPRGMTQIGLSLHTQEQLQRLRKLGANITFHTLSFIDRMHAIPKLQQETPDVECVAGTYMRLDVPQILDGALAALAGGADMLLHKRHVLYTDLDILWWRKVTPTELLSSVKEKMYAAAYSSQLQKNEGPRNAGVILYNVPIFRMVQPRALAFAFAVNEESGNIAMSELLLTSQDQGVLNHYFDHHPGRAFLEDKWNYKMFWSGSNHTAIVHYWAVKPSEGLRCFVREHSKENCAKIDAGLIPEKLKHVDFQGEALSLAISLDANLTFMQEALAAYDRYSELRDLALAQ
ncbi:unnamed protein product [Symbiodinium natans]|uniref:Nucleotide-diphospho-sugar transferase domain-containing protein n=1 Tax=Symbiodinium natans TaxID=878477 RepID=A0A812LIQ7_9DINO|nr:unnamed protein product [Symbiodinium natans]